MKNFSPTIKGGSMQDQQPEFQQYQKDIEYAETQHEELLRQYPEQWVAILNEEVVGSDSDVYRLIERLRRCGIPTERAVLRHLTEQEELLIL
jgi:ribosomal protein L20